MYKDANCKVYFHLINRWNVVSLAQYADDTALVATSKQPQLLLKYLETYLTELETWYSYMHVIQFNFWN